MSRTGPDSPFHHLFKPHPWHGVEPETGDPSCLRAFIEIVPSDTVKYELDKTTGHLTVDRPQKYSNVCPTLYGFLPRTYCGDRVAQRARPALRGREIEGDRDPLDICVLTEKTFSHGDFFLLARPIGGFRLIDGDQADDKIVAVLDGDVAYDSYRELSDLPDAQRERLEHYFLTYKQGPWAADRITEIPEVYGREEALAVIADSKADYAEQFGALTSRLESLLGALGRLDDTDDADNTDDRDDGGVGT